MAGASAGSFLLPLVLALLGAFMAGESHHARFLGGTAGLILGMAATVLYSRWRSGTRSR